MYNKVINFSQRSIATPDDLMSFKDFAEKHGFKESTVRKYERLGYYHRWDRGTFKISESEALSYWNEAR